MDIGADNTDVIEAGDMSPAVFTVTNEDEITEEKMAEAFARRAKRRAVYVHEKKQWYLCDGLVVTRADWTHLGFAPSPF